jgi:hypothetical protein
MSTPRDERLQVVVASRCGPASPWVFKVAAIYHTAVIQQCSANEAGAKNWTGQLMALGEQQPPLPEFIMVQPNQGREAHAYLWYIVEYYDRLRSTTIFLQDDAPRHLSGRLKGGWARLIDIVEEGYSFYSLAGNVVAAGHAMASIPISTFCALFVNFSKPATSHGNCKLWTSVTWAHFAVKREAIRTHRRHKYRQLVALFEDPSSITRAFENAANPAAAGGSEDSIVTMTIRGASFLERSWSFLFGCSRPIGLGECSFTQNTTRAQLFQRCWVWNKPLYGQWLGPPLDPMPMSRELGENASRIGCKHVHAFNTLPST